MLSESRFSKTTLTKRFTLQGENFDTPYTRHTYESYNKIYDVDVRDSDGSKSYHVNCGFEGEPEKLHRAIEEHFNL